MASARPLRDVFADLVGAPSATDDPAALLSGHGHPGLPDELIAEAVVSYAETAPLEVAEQLAPFVTAHSAAATGDEPGAGWLDLLADAPDVPGEEPADLDGLTRPDPAADSDADPGNNATGPDADRHSGPEDGLDFGQATGPEADSDFGTGAGSAWAVEPGAVDDVSDVDDVVETSAADLTADDFDTDDFTADDFADDSELDDGELDGEPDGGPLG